MRIRARCRRVRQLRLCRLWQELGVVAASEAPAQEGVVPMGTVEQLSSALRVWHWLHTASLHLDDFPYPDVTHRQA